MENIKWVFKCIKRHLDLINSGQQAALFVCAVNEQPSEEQSYRIKCVLKGALQISSRFCQPKCTFSTSPLFISTLVDVFP